MRDVAVAAGISPTSVLDDSQRAAREFSAGNPRSRLRRGPTTGIPANRLARNLVRRQSDMIGVIIEYVDNPFFAGLAAYLNRRVAEHNFQARIRDNRARRLCRRPSPRRGRTAGLERGRVIALVERGIWPERYSAYEYTRSLLWLGRSQRDCRQRNPG